MKYTIVCTLILLSSITSGQVMTAKIFSDNMVLQREIPIPVWGTAKPGEPITVKLEKSVVQTIADINGNWKLNLPKFQAGGPYTLSIEGMNNKIEFHNVLIGDVWFASGQSNMEHPMGGWEWIPYSAVNDYEKEIWDSNYPGIRLFNVPKFPSPVVQKDLPSGKWEVAGPESVAGFSAIGWFFAKEMHQKLKIPIGIINSSWGGTSIQTWMDRESLETFKDSLKLPVVPDLFDQNEWTKKVTTSIEKTKLRRMQISFPPKNFQFPKVNPDTLGAAWNSVDLLDKNNHFGNVVWLQKKIVISPEFVKQHLNLSLGFLSWQSQVFLNGKEIGYFPYPKPVVTVLPKDLIRSGENLLAIRLAQPWNDAQCLGNKEQYALSNPDHSFKISLSDDWLANSILEQITPVVESYPNIPAYLYNGMVAPIIPYGIKGYLWYQGEADAGRPLLYSQMFRSLITDWRKVWNQGDLPFLFFQISTYPLTHEQDKTADPWIKQREAQSTVLSLPNTGMVITYDIGDAYDIHPKNKKEFAHRLVLKALAL